MTTGIVVVNSGSTSLKFAVYHAEGGSELDVALPGHDRQHADGPALRREGQGGQAARGA